LFAPAQQKKQPDQARGVIGWRGRAESICNLRVKARSRDSNANLLFDLDCVGYFTIRTSGRYGAGRGNLVKVQEGDTEAAEIPMSGLHEDYGREIHGRGPSDRNFGGVFTAAFLFFGLSPLRHHGPVRLRCLVLSGALLVITLIRPTLFHAPNLIWTKCGRLLGRVVNPILMGLLFYLVFTPVAIVLRWRGKDLLQLATGQNSKTYWIQRSAAEEASDMGNQF